MPTPVDSAACGALLQEASRYAEFGIAAAFRELGIAALVAQPQTAAEVARHLRFQTDATTRFLNAAVGLGLATRDEIGAYCAGVPKTFPPPPSRDELRKNPRFAPLLASLEPVLTHFETVNQPMFTAKGFEGALRTGSAQWRTVFGDDASNAFDRLPQERFRTLMSAMHLLNRENDRELLQVYASPPAKTVLDVGGGTGAFAALLVQEKRAERVDVYERPETLAVLQEIFAAQTKAETRVRYLPGSFLDEGATLAGLPRGAQYDLAVLAWILHDWNEATARSILRRVHAAVRPGGKIAVIEFLLDENRLGPVPALKLDLTMLLQTEGRERTFVEYRSFLEEAGFSGVRVAGRTARRNLIEATRS